MINEVGYLVDVQSVQDLGLLLKVRRLALGLSRTHAGTMVHKTDTWVAGLEKWKPGYRPWANAFYEYALGLGFDEVDIFLCMKKFDLFPGTEATVRFFLESVRRLRS